MSDQLRFRDPAEELGFTMLPNAVLLSPALSNPGKVLYGLLRHFARGKRHCFPGQERLAHHLGCGERHVRRLLEELRALSLLSWERLDRNQTNRYWLEPLTPALAALGLPVPDRTPESGHEEDSG